MNKPTTGESHFGIAKIHIAINLGKVHTGHQTTGKSLRVFNVKTLLAAAHTTAEKDTHGDNERSPTVLFTM